MRFLSLVLCVCLPISLYSQQTSDTTKNSNKSVKPVVFTSIVLGASAGTFIAKSLGHQIDSDPCPNGKSVCLTGRYQDGWKTEAKMSDKLFHSVASYAIADAGMDMGLTPWKSSALTLGVGILFEVQQGYISRYDIGADAVGVAAAWVKHRFLNRHGK